MVASSTSSNMGDDWHFDLELEKLHYNIEALNWSVRNINDDQACRLAKTLESNESLLLRYLILYQNCIGSKGACAIANLFSTCCCNLKELWLPFNQIGTQGAIALANALRHNNNNKSLEILRLDGNDIGPDGIVAIASTLNKTRLVSLHMSENNIGDAGAKAIAQALLTNKTLKQLHANDASIQHEGAVALTKALRHNDTLQVLTLSLNAMDRTALACGLEHNYTLTKVSVCRSCQDIATFYTKLNQIGRKKILRTTNPVNMGCWPYFLAKVARDPKLLHYFVQAKPELFQMQQES